mgnify:CR=1 FL=1
MKTSTINDWGLNYNIIPRKSFDRLEVTNRHAFPVRLCPTCNIPYEEKRNEYRNIIIADYHEGFPTIGLTRKDCVKCRTLKEEERDD